MRNVIVFLLYVLFNTIVSYGEETKNNSNEYYVSLTGKPYGWFMNEKKYNRNRYVMVKDTIENIYKIAHECFEVNNIEIKGVFRNVRITLECRDGNIIYDKTVNSNNKSWKINYNKIGVEKCGIMYDRRFDNLYDNIVVLKITDMNKMSTFVFECYIMESVCPG
jgi:hypothetical protein